MIISKGGKDYTVPSSYKTLEDDYITISMGYDKEVYNKSEIVTLITMLSIMLDESKPFNTWLKERDKKAIQRCIDVANEHKHCFAYQIIEYLEELKEN